uniref:Uncharacterized protein MANES_16G117700 n=1 Tax=Rhizophora mucronata TaxID=61149 RepID=A0A2P2IVY0_RHIMU
MAIATGCCLNLFPPASGSESQATHPPFHRGRSRNEKWRSGCVAGIACVIIVGFEMGNTAISNEKLATAQVMQDLVAVESTKRTRWSDKRRCPPWHLNSLETIVPENLPRPTARRRWESVGQSTAAAPTVGGVRGRRSSNNCFTM